MEAAKATDVPVFALESPAGGVKDFDDCEDRPPGQAVRHKKRSKERVRMPAGMSFGRSDKQHQDK
jgi:hypothetical protein